MIINRRIREFFWRILGISYDHIQKVCDQTYLHSSKINTIGKHSYSNNSIVYRWSNKSLIKIGKYCSISYDVRFICDDGSHQFNIISNYPFKTNKIAENKGIIIGNDVWIGLGSKIMYGVIIGDGATIAAGAVVNKDVPPYTIVGGVPAKVIKEKCSRENATKMSKIAWWDWDEEIISERINDFRLSFPEFIMKYEKK